MEGMTQYGEILREIQYRARESQQDMADKVGVSAGFLSFVMSGRRKVPSTLTDKIIRLYDLDVTTVQLLRFAEIEKVEISLRGASIQKKLMAIWLKSKMDSLTEEQVQAIREVLEGSG
ncbi:MAG: helix-turn-helix transcriptional regulator [Candidatus Marinimicrobia bacterium]|nr:helix-turn-helix transcriptional regulator [Candidatus Neomarinimicrobiota bacterium]